MPVELSFTNTLCLATSVLCFITVAQGAETVVSTIIAPKNLASSISFDYPSQSSQPSVQVSSSYSVQSGATTLTTSLTSTTTVTSNILPSPSQSDPGAQYGNVTIHNHCNETLYLKSVGAHHPGGLRNDTAGWGTKKEDIVHVITPEIPYTEPYRMTCPIAFNQTKPGYCREQDKLAGQGVSMKIARNNFTSQDIMQFEYALVQNPARHDTFQRLDYDVSLLDCANPVVHPQAFTAQVADGTRNVAKITDFNATAADHAAKVEMCPGYRNGLSVTFPSDTKEEKCPIIKCDGSAICLGIYTFDRTRKNESSMACYEEYRGDMVLDLCAGRVAAAAKAS